MSWLVLGIAALVGLVYASTLRLTIRMVGRGADNGWDNAVGYLVVTTLSFVPLQHMLGTRNWLFVATAPLLLWAAQTISLKWIYEVRITHAWLIGLVHGLISTFVIGALTFVSGVVAVYVLYGKIVSDPMILIRFILGLLGIELPFDLPR